MENNRTRVHVDPGAVDLAGLVHDVDAAHVLRQLQEVFEHDDFHQLAHRGAEKPATAMQSFEVGVGAATKLLRNMYPQPPRQSIGSSQSR